MKTRRQTKRKRVSTTEQQIQQLQTQPDLQGFYMVPFGTGGSINRYLRGNLFRVLVNAKRLDYLELVEQVKDRKRCEQEKRNIANSIIDYILLLPGKFVEWKGGLWIEVTDRKKLMQKTMQALRQDGKKRKQEMRKKELIQSQNLLEPIEADNQARSRDVEKKRSPTQHQENQQQQYWHKQEHQKQGYRPFAVPNAIDTGFLPRTVHTQGSATSNYGMGAHFSRGFTNRNGYMDGDTTPRSEVSPYQYRPTTDDHKHYLPPNRSALHSPLVSGNKDHQGHGISMEESTRLILQASERVSRHMLDYSMNRQIKSSEIRAPTVSKADEDDDDMSQNSTGWAAFPLRGVEMI